MERLTKHSKQTSHENGICCTHFCGAECLEVGGNCAMNCKWEEAAWSRLAAYEDTGLTPESVEALKLSMMGKAIAEIKEFNGLPVDRLRELAEADKDGRVVVLPCKLGDGLWTFCSHPVEQVYSFTVTDISTFNGRTMLNTSRCGVIDARDVGKTVFRTREEAEKALEAWKNG
nr:MAG TPA: hypothetical protein [Caudoviricetes sp.]